jgi:hypothetical protein
MEFQRPQPVRSDARGAVHIFDPMQNRETVVSAEFELVEDRRLPPATIGSVAQLPDKYGRHRYVVNMWLQSDAHLAQPLHFIDGSEVLRSFGVVSERTGGLITPFTNQRILTADEVGRVYSSRVYEYLVEVWSEEGQPIAAFEQPGLNSPEVRPERYSKSHPVPHRMMDLRVDDRERLWILRSQRRENWMNAFEEFSLPDESKGLRLVGSLDEVYSSIVEVLDLATGRIVARLEHDAVFTAFVGSSMLLENRWLDSGVPQIVMWSLNSRR